ncbi:MAG: hypothetical protein M0Z46_07875 [Actinomycetota bacterium]|jgi:hypothetical protein|nr:hypothetical protein [Actinomycetota bacterium]
MVIFRSGLADIAGNPVLPWCTEDLYDQTFAHSAFERRLAAAPYQGPR